MSESLDIEKAFLISDESERVFAVAMILAFANFKVVHEPTIVAKSGLAKRKTKADFELTNTKGEKLFIEVTKGSKITKRKRRQRKTAGLAGLGEMYITLFGKDIEQLKDPRGDIRLKMIKVLQGKFNAKLFTLE